jgi:hypothetical protein
MKRAICIIGACLAAAATSLHAQVDDKAARRQQLKDAHAKALKACEGKPTEAHRACVRSELCAQSKDPKACQERFAKADAAKAVRAKAAKACEGKQGAERSDCMRREACAQAKDPAQCEAHIKEAVAKRERIREACKGKAGEEYRACLRDQRGEQRGKT